LIQPTSKQINQNLGGKSHYPGEAKILEYQMPNDQKSLNNQKHVR